MKRTKEEILGELERAVEDIRDYADLIENEAGNVRDLLKELGED